MAFLALSVYTPPVFGQNYNVVQEKYLRGDLKGAESSAKRALETKLPRSDRSKVLKILGLVQYLSGNKTLAAKSFEQSIALDPNISIQPQEALDPSAIAFFQNLKSKSRKTAASSDTPPQTQSKSKKPIAGTSPVKKTLLKVVSNVQKAQVSIDGILAGTSNELINVEHGKVEVEIKAPGYLPRKAVVPITKDAENTITLNLEKPKAQEKLAARPQASGTVIAQRGSGIKTPHKKPLPRRSTKEEDLFAPTPTDIGDFNHSARASKKGSPPPPPDPIGDPAAAFEEEAKMGGAPLMTPSPQVGAYPQQTPPVMPGTQAPQPTTPGFGMAAPVPAQPQPIYIQPPIIYQAPIYQPPPMYYPPPSNLAQPAPPPPTDPYSQAPPPDLGPPDPSLKSETAKEKNEITFLTILPYGIGQLSQERYLIAGIFAGSGVAAFAFYMKLQEDIDSQTKEYNQVIARQCNGATNQLSDETKAQCNTYLSEQKKNISESKGNQNLALIATIGIGAISSLEAVMWEPESKNAIKTKKRKTRTRKYKGFSYNLEPSIHKSRAYYPYLQVEPLNAVSTSHDILTHRFATTVKIGVDF